MAQVLLADVNKIFGKNQVLTDINVDVPDGSFMVMVGPSGCGKSTALRCLAGLEEVSSGSIFIGNEDVTHKEPKDRNIAMVFQNYALYPHMNVFENITYGLKVRGMSLAERKQKAEDAAKLLSLEGLLDRMPKQLSGGQRQRVAMGRAIVREPSVFLFDEPLSNLDANLRNQMRIELRKLHERLATTSIYVTHDQVEAMTLAEKILVLKGGHIQQYGSPDEIYQRPLSVFVAQFMGSPSMNMMRVKHKDNALYLPDNAKLSMDILAEDIQAELIKEDIILGVRAEDLILDSEGAITVNVDIIEALGADTLAYCSLQGENALVDNQSIIIRLHGSHRPQAGEKLKLSVRPGMAHAFDAVTEKRCAQQYFSFEIAQIIYCIKIKSTFLIGRWILLFIMERINKSVES